MTTTAPETLADELRNARQAADLTQKQLADLTGVSAASIQSWGQGVRVPRNSFALRLVQGALASLNDEGRPRQSDDPDRKLPLADDRVYQWAKDTFDLLRADFPEEADAFMGDEDAALGGAHFGTATVCVEGKWAAPPTWRAGRRS
jgi:transcriptional regulator with XRE-family HTH domain